MRQLFTISVYNYSIYDNCFLFLFIGPAFRACLIFEYQISLDFYVEVFIVNFVFINYIKKMCNSSISTHKLIRINYFYLQNVKTVIGTLEIALWSFLTP